MATRDLPRPANLPSSATPLPRINLFTMFRLGLFQMGLGLLSLLTLGILNQVLISELQIPAILASGAIAMYQFVSPARVWMGQVSDSKPIRGYHRTGYVWLGMVLQAVCLVLAIQVVWQLGASAAEWMDSRNDRVDGTASRNVCALWPLHCHQFHAVCRPAGRCLR
jgi:BCD family chlorophyll transporter-like MFS transporter